MPTLQTVSDVPIARAAFQDATSIHLAHFSPDAKALCIGNGGSENKVVVVDPRTGDLLLSFNSDEHITGLAFASEKRFNQSESYTLIVLGKERFQLQHQVDKRSTFTEHKLIAAAKNLAPKVHNPAAGGGQQGGAATGDGEAASTSGGREGAGPSGGSAGPPDGAATTTFTCLSNSFDGEIFAVGTVTSSDSGASSSHIIFYHIAKSNKQLQRMLLPRDSRCASVVAIRGGTHLLVGCNNGRVIVYEDLHRMVQQNMSNADEDKRRVARAFADNANKRFQFSYKIKCDVRLPGLEGSPVSHISVDSAGTCTVIVNRRNRVSTCSTQALVSGKLETVFKIEDNDTANTIYSNFSSQTEKPNLVVNSHCGKIVSMDACQARNLVATCSVDNTVHVWDLVHRTCDVVARFPSKKDIEDPDFDHQEMTVSNIIGPPDCVAFHPVGYHLALCLDDALHIFALMYNRLELSFTYPLSKCKQAKYSRGGQYIAVLSGRSIELFETVPPYAHLVTLKGHLGEVTSLCWSRDDLRLSSTCNRGAVLQWDVNPGYQDKSQRILRNRTDDLLRKMDNYVCVQIDDVTPLAKRRMVAAVSFDGSLQFVSGGHIQHRLASKAFGHEEASCIHISTMTKHFSNTMSLELKEVDDYFAKNGLVDRPKVGLLLVGTKLGSIIAFTDWQRLEKDPSDNETLAESSAGNVHRFVLPRAHSMEVSQIATLQSEESGITTVISGCHGGIIAMAQLSLVDNEAGLLAARRDAKQSTAMRASARMKKIQDDQSEAGNLVLVPSRVIKRFESDVWQYTLQIGELTTEVEYQRERAEKQKRDNLKIFVQKEAKLVKETNRRTVDLQQQLTRVEKTHAIDVKEIKQKHEEGMRVLEDKFEGKLRVELDISHKLREESERNEQENAERVKALEASHAHAMQTKDREYQSRLSDKRDALASLETRRSKENARANQMLKETELDYDRDLVAHHKDRLRERRQFEDAINELQGKFRLSQLTIQQMQQKESTEKQAESDHAEEKHMLTQEIGTLQRDVRKLEEHLAERDDELNKMQDEKTKLTTELKNLKKQIFLQQELSSEMQNKMEPMKRKLQMMDSTIVKQDDEVNKQLHTIMASKVQIGDKDRLIRTLRGELNKSRALVAKLRASAASQEQEELQGGAEGPAGKGGKTTSGARRPSSSRTSSGGPTAQEASGRRGALDADDRSEKQLHNEMRRQRAIIEKKSDGLIKKAALLEEKASAISEERMYENMDLLEENMRLRKHLKESERKVQSMHAAMLQRGSSYSFKSAMNTPRGGMTPAAATPGAQRARTAQDGLHSEEGTPQLHPGLTPGSAFRPSSAPSSRGLASTPRPKSGGQLLKGSTSRLIKSVSHADKGEIVRLGGEVEAGRRREMDLKMENRRLMHMLEGYRHKIANQNITAPGHQTRPGTARI